MTKIYRHMWRHILSTISLCFISLLVFHGKVYADPLFSKAAAWSVEKGIVTGTDVLNGKCTKGMLAVTIWAAKNMPAPTEQPTYYDADGYILMAEQWASGLHVMEPVSENMFGTQAVVTRRDVAEAVWRAVGTPQTGNMAVFTDVAETDPSNTAISFVAGRNFMKGFTSTMFAPDATCTGMEMTSAVYRATIGGANRTQYMTPQEYWENGAFSATWDGTATNASQITREQLVSATARVVLEAKNGGYHYGSSGSLPPTDDGLISCDRVIAKALWYLGFTDQPRGGITCGNMTNYLINHGFICTNNFSDIGYGSIVLVRNRSKNSPHTFLTLDFDQTTMETTKFDEGRQARVDWTAGMQPFVREPWYYNYEILVFNCPSP